MRIAQYNILSSELATKFFYNNTETKYLQPAFRYQLLLDHLAYEVCLDSIICLQEVSLTILEQLIIWFNDNNYDFQHISYGNTRNGYMSIMIAYPKIYKLFGIKFIN